ncbi:MAG: hypothetical protein KDC35_20015 [Acidobacteria bacterium]|nr:hypothetical protein [Acidobacteriota bacterium]
MITQEKDPHAERIQVLGRSILSHVQQVFRNADLFEPNNQIFVRLAQTLASYIKESYRMVGGCSIHVNAHQVFLEDSRVFIDSGLIESVAFLSNFFAGADIGGLIFHEECWDPKTLIKTMFALRESILDDKARGEAAIMQGLGRRHSPYITAIRLSNVETMMTGIRDEENARRFAIRNAAKLAMFINDMDRQIQNQETPRINVGYRVLLNLIRVNEQYPQIIHALMASPVDDRTKGRVFYGVIMILAIARFLNLGRQAQIDFGLAALFQCLGEQLVPPSIRQSERLEEFRAELPHRAVGWLLDSRFVNRSLYYRTVLAYQTPRHKANQEESPLPVSRLLRAVNHVAEAWKLSPKPRPFYQCIQMLLASNDPTVDKAFVMVISKAFNIIPVTTLTAIDASFVAVVLENSGDHVRLISIPQSRNESVRKLEWNLGDQLKKEEFSSRTVMLKPSSDGPNAIPSLFLAHEH